MNCPASNVFFVKDLEIEKNVFFHIMSMREDHVKKIVLIIFILTSINFCAPVMTQNNIRFGNTMAQKGLWNEALYRWEKMLSQDKESAALYNNIAVALEHLGKPEEARIAYEKAMELEPDHREIKKNYDKFNAIQKKEK